MMKLVCGISLLCKRSQGDKLEAVFIMLDENGDGYVTADEPQQYAHHNVIHLYCNAIQQIYIHIYIYQ